MKLIRIIVATCFIFSAATSMADHHTTGPLGYGMSYVLKVSDPAAIAGAMTEVRTTDLGRNNPSTVVLNQLVAGGEPGATHIIGVFYQSAANIDAAQAMNEAMKVGEKMGPVFQAASERLQVVMWTLLRASAREGAVTSDNPVSMGYLVQVTDQSAFMAAFDPLWKNLEETFPGNLAFGSVLADGASPGTHFIQFTANDMETLLGAMQAFQTSEAMAAYMELAPSFRSIVSESIIRRVLYFPEASS